MHAAGSREALAWENLELAEALLPLREVLMH